MKMKNEKINILTDDEIETTKKAIITNLLQKDLTLG
jgi:hypothetical protein